MSEWNETEFARILEEIDRVDGCEATKRSIKRILRTRTGRRIRFSEKAFRFPERVRAAALMLEAGRSRAEIREALRARFHVSGSCAYEIIAEALDKRGPRGSR